ACLVEVGTGFHQELSGRENIFLNGSILGMSKAEIREQFDAIVEFSGVETFLDTPVKRYSSGMYVRLAFVVAAHLRTEIMVIDEVLAVGDADFQQKCLGKMKDVATDGRTVLFVSHNLSAVKSLCTRACLLESGRLIKEGETTDVLSHYLSRRISGEGEEKGGEFIKSVKLCQEALNFGESLQIEIEVESPREEELGINLEIRTESNELVLLNSTKPHDGVELPRGGSFTLTLRYPKLLLAVGTYHLSAVATRPGDRELETIHADRALTVLGGETGGAWPYRAEFGRVQLEHEWEVEK
ncbi:MAG: ABC transporter ATP-binding protein, partial [Verrucomicrobiota bacterium]